MATHISKLCSSAVFHLHNISRNRKFLDPEEKNKSSKCTGICMENHSSLTWMVRRPLQSLLLSYTAENSQKTFEANTESETEKGVHHNMSTLFVQLTQVLMSRIVFTLESQGQYSLRTSGGILLASPTIRTKVTIDNRSFQVATPKLWNALPRQLRDNPHLPIFIRHLETHLSSLLIITWIFTRYISIF